LVEGDFVEEYWLVVEGGDVGDGDDGPVGVS
jgi:hypothetical protein